MCKLTCTVENLQWGIREKHTCRKRSKAGRRQGFQQANTAWHGSKQAEMRVSRVGTARIYCCIPLLVLELASSLLWTCHMHSTTTVNFSFPCPRLPSARIAREQLCTTMPRRWGAVDGTTQGTGLVHARQALWDLLAALQPQPYYPWTVYLLVKCATFFRRPYFLLGWCHITPPMNEFFMMPIKKQHLLRTTGLQP